MHKNNKKNGGIHFLTTISNILIIKIIYVDKYLRLQIWEKGHVAYSDPLLSLINIFVFYERQQGMVKRYITDLSGIVFIIL